MARLRPRISSDYLLEASDGEYAPENREWKMFRWASNMSRRVHFILHQRLRSPHEIAPLNQQSLDWRLEAPRCFIELGKVAMNAVVCLSHQA